MTFFLSSLTDRTFQGGCMQCDDFLNFLRLNEEGVLKRSDRDGNIDLEDWPTLDDHIYHSIRALGE